MITATKIFTFDMAHTLPGHEGLCRNLHGHTYKLEVTAVRTDTPVRSEGPDAGMVVDFSDLKRVVKEEIVDKLDHAVALCLVDEFERELYRLLSKSGQRVVQLPYRPTAELMAADFLEILTKRLSGTGITISKIKLWETPTSFAEVINDEI